MKTIKPLNIRANGELDFLALGALNPPKISMPERYQFAKRPNGQSTPAVEK